MLLAFAENYWVCLLDEKSPLFGFAAEDENTNVMGFTNCSDNASPRSKMNLSCLNNYFVTPETSVQDWPRVCWQLDKGNATTHDLNEKFSVASNWFTYKVRTRRLDLKQHSRHFI
jgi:hypothetical protein